MKRLAVVAAAVLAASLTACSQSPEPTAAPAPAAPQASAPDMSAGTPATAPATEVIAGPVLETMDSGGYTYVLVDTGTGQVWAASPQFEVQVGEQVTVTSPMPMPGYRSKTLDRTFELLYFSPAITAGAATVTVAQANGHPGGPIAAAAPSDVDLAGIAAAEGGETVGSLYERKTELAGQQVQVRGKVVKFTGGIMGKNWIHLRDGTGGEGSNDLTVTTAATAAVGDTVLVSGVTAVDKDFGYGYRYSLLLEDAAVTVE